MCVYAFDVNCIHDIGEILVWGNIFVKGKKNGSLLSTLQTKNILRHHRIFYFAFFFLVLNCTYCNYVMTSIYNDYSVFSTCVNEQGIHHEEPCAYERNSYSRWCSPPTRTRIAWWTKAVFSFLRSSPFPAAGH